MKAKRSLGQNFFVNKNLRDYIVEKVAENSSEYIVEIGPGLGFFTERITEIFTNVIAVEKDVSLAQNLKLRFKDITVIEQDFLDINLDIFKGKNITYFGSLPYNVSKPIIKKIIEHSTFSNKAFFIVQKEVAEKYLYRKPYNILSLTTHIYANVKKEFDISPDSFRPKPKVNSALISLTPNRLENIDTKGLEELIHLSFRQPRKNLKNNLKNTKYSSMIRKYENTRPAELSVDEYISILS